MVPFKKFAYLILTEDLKTREVSVNIWSEPPWHQSRTLKGQVQSVLFETYVVKELEEPYTGQPTYQEARDKMVQALEALAQYSPLMAWALNEVQSQDCFECHMMRPISNRLMKCEKHSGVPSPWETPAV